MSASTPVRLLLVCTGNVARSPMAERLLVAEMARRLKCSVEAVRQAVHVSSAGTAALLGEPMTAETQEIVAAAGGDPGDHVARMLTEDVLLTTDVVLALTRAHSAAVLTMRPQLLRSTFTLREAARLASRAAADDAVAYSEDDLGQAWRDLPSRLARARRWEQLAPDADDVVDPFGRSRATYARAGVQIATAVQAVLGAVVLA